ncbi:50S ribosomal protein L12 [Sarracenia purpurea var. burkii]
MASTLSTITLRSPSYPTASTAYSNAAITFPKQTLEFPLRTPKTYRRATFLRPIAAVEAPENIVKLGDQISTLTLSDAQKLVEYLQDKLGVSAAAFAPAAVAPVAPGVGADAPEAPEEKTEFDVVIEEIPLEERVVDNNRFHPCRATAAPLCGLEFSGLSMVDSKRFRPCRAAAVLLADRGLVWLKHVSS